MKGDREPLFFLVLFMKQQNYLASERDFPSYSMISLVNAVGTPHPQAQQAWLQTSWIWCLFCENNYFYVIN